MWCISLLVGIFERHKLLFSLQIAIKVQQNAGDVKQSEIDFFVKVWDIFNFSQTCFDLLKMRVLWTSLNLTSHAWWRSAYFFTQGNIALAGAAGKPFDWLSDKAWLDCAKLSKLPKFEQLIEAMTDHASLWKAWIQSDSPEETSYPPPYGDRSVLLPFQRLLLLR